MAKKKINMHGVRVVNRKTGNSYVLLNPAQKGRKFATELSYGRAITNDLKRKVDKNGNQVRLTKEQKAYRAGYLDSRKDCAKAYKYNKNKRKKSSGKK